MKSTNSNHFRLQKSPSFFISTTTHNSLYNTTLHASCCIYSNKDKNFKANHNSISNSPILPFVVSIATKIRILKQITTTGTMFNIRDGCIYSNKDKNFKANHNYIYPTHRMSICCICSNKDSDFKANHNYRRASYSIGVVPSEVVYNSGNSEGSASRRKVWRW